MVTTIRQIEAALNRDPRSASRGFLDTNEYATRLRQFIGIEQSRTKVTLAGIHKLAADFGQSLLDAHIVRDDTALVALVKDRREAFRDLRLALLALNQTGDQVLFTDDEPTVLNKVCRDEVRPSGRDLFTYDVLLKLDPSALILWRVGR